MTEPQNPPKPQANNKKPELDKPKPEKVPEIGGQSGPEPTRYGDWENGGRCTDF